MILVAAFVLFFISETIRSERRRLYGTSTVIMEVDKVIFPGLTNGTRIYSPVILSREWSTLGRLAAMVVAACFGATINGYFVTSFMIDRELKRIENVYHCCLGFADMIVTSGIIPIAAVVLLSGVWDIYPVCQVLQTLAAASTYSYSIYFAMVAGENYFRVCHFTVVTDPIKKKAIAISAALVFPCCIILAAVGTYLRLDYDYCERRYYGDLNFRQATSILIHGTCSILTTVALITCYIQIRQENRLPVVYRRIHQLPGDLPTMIKLNIFSYILYVVAWTPYLIVVNQFPDVGDDVYYQCAWLGIGRSLITSMLYGSIGRIFGRTYSNIFFYCFCKTGLYDFYPHQRKHYAKYSTPRASDNGEVHIHVMQQAINSGSPQRASSSTHDTQEL